MDGVSENAIMKWYMVRNNEVFYRIAVSWIRLFLHVCNDLVKYVVVEVMLISELSIVMINHKVIELRRAGTRISVPLNI